MKVSKCCENETKKAVELTWDEMVKREGVYRRTSSGALRFIVISARIVLYYNPIDNALELASTSCWDDGMYIRTNETVCFGLKAG